jgi:hypothetical protein
MNKIAHEDVHTSSQKNKNKNQVQISRASRKICQTIRMPFPKGIRETLIAIKFEFVWAQECFS